MDELLCDYRHALLSRPMDTARAQRAYSELLYFASNLRPPGSARDSAEADKTEAGGVAAKLRSALDLTLMRDELACIASFLTDEVEKDDEAVRLLIGDGHSGYGLYAAHPEYPEEGAIFVKALPVPAGVPAEDATQRLRAALQRVRDGIASDRCDGDTEYALGVNAACANHVKLVERVMADVAGVRGTSNDQGENHG